ncbi:MAG: cytochrome c-550 [Symploca sp. SIO2E6]|nr:cytochrome c-550 [Symploca sp. SIO2E6]
MKRLILLAVATVFFALQLAVGTAAAIEIPPEIRTVKLNEQGDTAELSLEQVKIGKRLFVDTCAQCHAQGGTKTNPNVGLGPDALAGAIPPRDNIVNLIDYLNNPTTYDGEIELSEFHPSIKSADIFSEMRNLSEEDLYAISGHILLMPKVKGPVWGGPKSLR